MFVRWLCIPLGRICGWGYWFINYQTNTAFLSAFLRSKYGLPPQTDIETIEEATQNGRMWDEMEQEIIRSRIEICRRYRIKFKANFYIRANGNERRLHLGIGYLLFRKGAEQPWAMYGWSREVEPCARSEASMEAWRAIEDVKQKAGIPKQLPASHPLYAK